jgi:short-subunit dehydrogenase
MDTKNQGKTLVTGASSGIGLHLAHEFAKRGHPLVLVAPVQSELRAIADEFERDHGISVQIIARDLREERAAREIFNEIQSDSTPLEILVNNAAHGQRGKFWEIPIETDISMVELNILAYLRLTKLFLPGLIRRGRGGILNTASVAGFMPGPMQAVYHATKAFVLSWSEALATELDKTGVTVTALCPGPTDTDFFEKADALDTKAFQSVMAPQDVAKTGYEAFMAGKSVVVAGAVNKAMVFSRHVLPASAQARLNEKMYEQIPPDEQKLKRGDKELAAAQEDDPARIF